jgi:L-alanine-DL-glutamate epimerase-like enolase superfamily enzyme
MCHGVGLATFHFMMSNPHNVSPRCEYLDVLAGSSVPWVFKNEPRPKNGVLEIRATPGFGFTLDEAAFEEGAEVAPIW